MPPAAIATLILAALLVLAVAVVLVWVIGLLVGIHGALGRVTDRVRSIARRTEPIEPTISAINADLRDVADGLETLARGGEESAPGRAGARPAEGAPDR